jgi:predicted RNA binding protein YcfA (HicA-like mRNA interferase family)
MLFKKLCPIDEGKNPSRIKLPDAEKILKRAGYSIARTGNHNVWKHPDPSKPNFSLPSHQSREISPGITRNLFALSEAQDKKEGLEKACWKGYTAIGLKKKNGRTVPNCVPEEVEIEETTKQKLHAFTIPDNTEKGEVNFNTIKLRNRFVKRTLNRLNTIKKPRNV